RSAAASRNRTKSFSPARSTSGANGWAFHMVMASCTICRSLLPDGKSASSMTNGIRRPGQRWSVLVVTIPIISLLYVASKCQRGFFLLTFRRGKLDKSAWSEKRKGVRTQSDEDGGTAGPSPTPQRSIAGLLLAGQVNHMPCTSCSGRRSAVQWGRQRSRRADRAPGRGRAGEGLAWRRASPAAGLVTRVGPAHG